MVNPVYDLDQKGGLKILDVPFDSIFATPEFDDSSPSEISFAVLKASVVKR